MFSKNGIKSNGDSLVANRITEGTTVIGDINAQADLRVDGRINGNILCSAKVIVGNASQIAGNIKCADLTIEGKLKGNIEVSGVLFFRSSAQFEGDVKYKKLIVEEGAQISGSLTNTAGTTKSATQSTVQNGQTTNA